MGLEFLSRIRRTSLITAALAAVFTATYRSPGLALGLVLGCLWSLVNLFALELLVVGITTPGRDRHFVLRKAGSGALMLALLLALGGILLSRLEPLGLLLGFALPYAVLLLKAFSLQILTSSSWRRWIGVSRRIDLLLAAAVLLVWAWRPLLALAAGEGGASHAAEEGAGGAQELPNWITLVTGALGERSPVAHFLHTFENLIYSLLVAAAISLIAYLASRRATDGVPGRLQNLVELAVEGLHDFVVGVLGPKYGPRYLPYLGTLFLYILFMNLLGIVPLMKSPTSSLNITAALGLTTFVYVQIEGLRNLGLVGYVDHLAGTPRSVVSWVLVPLMLPVHVLGELAKPISLSCRLFGNVFGEDMLLAAFVGLGVSLLAFSHLPIGIPLQFPFIFLALMTSTLQALIFTVLSSIYLLLMLPHEHEEEAHSATH